MLAVWCLHSVIIFCRRQPVNYGLPLSVFTTESLEDESSFCFFGFQWWISEDFICRELLVIFFVCRQILFRVSLTGALDFLDVPLLRFWISGNFSLVLALWFNSSLGPFLFEIGECWIFDFGETDLKLLLSFSRVGGLGWHSLVSALREVVGGISSAELNRKNWFRPTYWLIWFSQGR